MGTISEKLSYLNDTKTAIKEALVNKGVTVSDSDTFRSYADKVTSIEGIAPPSIVLPNLWNFRWTNNAFDTTKTYDMSWLKYCDSSNLTTMDRIFNDNTGNIPLVNFDFTGWDTSNVTNMYRVFNNCVKVTSLDLSMWDVSKVTNMSQMFLSCKSLKSIDLTGWNPTAVTIMDAMFNVCSSLVNLDLSGFTGTSSNTTLNYLCNECSALETVTLNGMDTSAVTNMKRAFYRCNSLKELNIGEIDTSKVTTFEQFLDLNNNTGITSLDLSKWDVSQSTNFSSFLSGFTKITSYSAPTTLNTVATIVGGMHYNWQSIEDIDVSWLASSVLTNTNSMFRYCYAVKTIHLDNFDSTAVTNYTYMFDHCTLLTTVYVTNCSDTTKEWLIARLSNAGYTFTESTDSEGKAILVKS